MGILFLGGNFEHGREKLDLLSVPYVMLAMMMNRDRVEDSRYSSVSIDDYRGDLRGGASGMACRAPQSCGDGVP